MPFSANPFIVLSYVSGPAVLTNAAALLLLSTSNRFPRAIDRSRFLADNLPKLSPAARAEIAVVGRRVRLIARVMTGLYLATATFALATLLSILGAVFAPLVGSVLIEGLVVSALLCGLAGFLAFVAAALGLVVESRWAVRALELETSEALGMLEDALQGRQNAA